MCTIGSPTPLDQTAFTNVAIYAQPPLHAPLPAPLPDRLHKKQKATPTRQEPRKHHVQWDPPHPAPVADSDTHEEPPSQQTQPSPAPSLAQHDHGQPYASKPNDAAHPGPLPLHAHSASPPPRSLRPFLHAVMALAVPTAPTNAHSAPPAHVHPYRGAPPAPPAGPIFHAHHAASVVSTSPLSAPTSTGNSPPHPTLAILPTLHIIFAILHKQQNVKTDPGPNQHMRAGTHKDVSPRNVCASFNDAATD